MNETTVLISMSLAYVLFGCFFQKKHILDMLVSSPDTLKAPYNHSLHRYSYSLCNYYHGSNSLIPLKQRLCS